jgi:hypothetical protein
VGVEVRDGLGGRFVPVGVEVNTCVGGSGGLLVWVDVGVGDGPTGMLVTVGVEVKTCEGVLVGLIA